MFKLQLDRTEFADILNIGFIPGINATNAEYTSFVDKSLSDLVEQAGMRGKLIKINGACSLAIGIIIGHKLAHLYASVAVFDPKLKEKGAYVVCLSHGGLAVGTTID